MRPKTKSTTDLSNREIESESCNCFSRIRLKFNPNNRFQLFRGVFNFAPELRIAQIELPSNFSIISNLLKVTKPYSFPSKFSSKTLEKCKTAVIS